MVSSRIGECRGCCDNRAGHLDMDRGSQDGLSNWDIVDDLPDGHFWDNLSDLRSDLSVSSDWGQNLLFGHQWFEISSLGCSEDSDRGLDCNWDWDWSWDSGTG